MNPLNPWVAFTEILLLMGLSFLLGQGIAWFQYRKRIQAQQEAIRKLQHTLDVPTAATDDE